MFQSIRTGAIIVLLALLAISINAQQTTDSPCVNKLLEDHAAESMQLFQARQVDHFKNSDPSLRGYFTINLSELTPQDVYRCFKSL